MTDPVEDARLRYEALIENIRAANPSVKTEEIAAAYAFAYEAHGDQRRKDGSLYITHPIAVAQIVNEMGLDSVAIQAALLHDTLEDTAVTHEEIARRFGGEVADIVEGVTKLTRVVYTSKEEEQMDNLRKMLMAMAKDIRVILIKIADRLHNCRTMEYQTREKQLEKTAETMEIYAPIAHRLGLSRYEQEMEDLCIKYLDPVAYEEITRGLSEMGHRSEEFMAHTKENLEKHLSEAGIDASVTCRIKQIYSIYRKMYGQNKELSEILDLYAFRVIVENVTDCYNVLGHVHELYKPIPGHFKDYIGTPKTNGYQSIHTTVIGSEGIPFEVQIRTWQMHEVAEYGVAAHWKYKEGKQEKTGDEKRFEWIRRLLESQQDVEAQDFIHTMKVDMFGDEVFVFTPQGDVVNLPAGSTPIDFAYNIHSAVGNHMMGATVNGRMVPFNTSLQNGDIVQILTSASAKGPSRDWLNIVKSPQARSKIRQWIKREKREENIAHGRAALDAELKRLGYGIRDLGKQETQAVILKKFSFPSLDELYAAIGYGGLSAQKAANRVRDELRQMERPSEGDSAESIPSVPVFPQSNRAVHGVVVEGLDNCLVKFARCCTPVPGDAIEGFITRGYGVSIHRSDCINFLQSGQEKGRWVRVGWARTDELYPTELKIIAGERDGLILDITTVLGGLKLKIDAITARDEGDGIAVTYITIEVHDRDELMTAMRRLYGVRGVSEVQRAGGKGIVREGR